LPSCYGTDEVNRILLLLDVVSPDAEDVASAIDIYVVLNAAYVSRECFIIICLELFLNLNRMPILSGHCVNGLSLLNFLSILLALEFFPLLLLFGKVLREVSLFVAQSCLGPLAEGSRLVVLDPILHSRLKESTPGLKLLKGLQPGIETSGL
jgi:hypothetical protein